MPKHRPHNPALVVLFLLGAPALGQAKSSAWFVPSSLEAGPLVGTLGQISERDLGPPDAGQIPSVLSPQLGGRVSATWIERLRLEGELGWLAAVGRDDSHWNHALSGRLGVTGTLFSTSAEWTPFLSVGGGVYQALGASRDNDGRWDYGVGALGRLGEDWRLRADVRHLITDGQGFEAISHNVEVLISAEFALWDADIAQPPRVTPTPEPVAPPEPKAQQSVVPVDTDGDSVGDSADACPELAGVPDLQGCPDADRDGITDAADLCPAAAGPFSGCPDTDGDSFNDHEDGCPNEPEDSDGFEDGDGCPEADNDRDGFLDKDDQCPLDAELKNNFEDDDGCPEPDLDQDGIVDGLDRCKDAPETYNGVADDDGCPDGRRTIELTATEVKVHERVFFASATSAIDKKSFKLLDIIANALKQNVQVTKLQVEGHTDDIGDAAHNLALSTTRAEAVRAYLIAHGVEAQRITAQGYGESKPLCADVEKLPKAKTNACRSKNRRVEFKILELHGKPIAIADDGDGAAQTPVTPQSGETLKTPQPAQNSGDQQ